MPGGEKPSNPYNRKVHATFTWTEELPPETDIELGADFDMTGVGLTVYKVTWSESVPPGQMGSSPHVLVEMRPSELPMPPWLRKQIGEDKEAP